MVSTSEVAAPITRTSVRALAPKTSSRKHKKKERKKNILCAPYYVLKNR